MYDTVYGIDWNRGGAGDVDGSAYDDWYNGGYDDGDQGGYDDGYRPPEPGYGASYSAPSMRPGPVSPTYVAPPAYSPSTSTTYSSGGYVSGGYYYPPATTTTVTVQSAPVVTTTTTEYVTEVARPVHRRVYRHVRSAPSKTCYCRRR